MLDQARGIGEALNRPDQTPLGVQRHKSWISRNLILSCHFGLSFAVNFHHHKRLDGGFNLGSRPDVFLHIAAVGAPSGGEHHEDRLALSLALFQGGGVVGAPPKPGNRAALASQQTPDQPN